MHLSTGSTPNGGHCAPEGPPAPLFAASFFLAGLGTVYLGPVLPQLLHEWSLSDQRGGLLLLAKFTGAFFGGVCVPRRLRLGILAGHVLAAAGFFAFASAHSLAPAALALALTGFGLGEIIASTNILAGRRWPAHTGSALSLINLFWSLGAVSTGLLAAALLPRFGWRKPTLAMALLLLLIGTVGAIFTRHPAIPVAPNPLAPNPLVPDPLSPDPLSPDPLSPDPAGPTPNSTPPIHPSNRAAVLRFGALLLLYGGLETCLTAWLTTFTLRFARGTLLGGQSGFVVLWVALTFGRGLASLAMRYWPETLVQRSSLLLSLAFIAALATSHSTAAIAAACILLGLALAPVFPSTYGLFLRQNPGTRAAGSVLAVSGLGAAFFPWLMGAVSTHTGSLRLAMLVPASIIPAMLLFTRRESPHA